jgi:hypothetical protein
MTWIFFACQTGSVVVEKQQQDEQQEQCLEQGVLTLEEEIDWFFLEGQDSLSVLFHPTVLENTCDSFVASTSAEWLEVQIEPNGSAIEITLQTEALRSGKHTTTVSIWDDNGNDILAEIPVQISALVTPPAEVESSKRAMIIGVDGLDGEEMHIAQTPTINRLQTGGLWSREASTQLTGNTSSGPGWTSILTGVEVKDHYITSNGNYGARNQQFPSFLKRLRDNNYTTGVSIQWADIFSILESDAYNSYGSGNQQEVTDWVIEQLESEEGYDAYFVHLDDVDHAGHAHGFTADQEEYNLAIEEADRNIGEILDAILEGPNIQNEEWMIIVTTDHGGDVAGTHGTIAPDYQVIPLIISGATYSNEKLPEGFGSHLDVHPTILDFFDIPNDELELDGLSWNQMPELECDDGIDNDNDGEFDCSDLDCHRIGECIEQNCNDGNDNDMDNLIDCDDTDCISDESCFECNPIDLESSIGEVQQNVYPSSNNLEGSCGGSNGDEALFSWQAPNDGVFIIDTMEWYRDTVLYVLEEDCFGQEIACNEKPSSSERSVVSITATIDQLYTIVVDTDGVDSTETGLSIRPQSDSCSYLEQSSDSWTEPFIHEDYAYSGACVPMISPMWWEWTAPIDGTFTIDTLESDFDTVLYVLDQCSGSELSCNDDNGSYYSATTVTLTEGDNILIGVGSFAGRTLSGTIGVTISN